MTTLYMPCRCSHDLHRGKQLSDPQLNLKVCSLPKKWEFPLNDLNVLGGMFWVIFMLDDPSSVFLLGKGGFSPRYYGAWPRPLTSKLIYNL